MSKQTKEFLDTCNVYIYGGKLVVLCKQFGCFDWPKTLTYEGHDYLFNGQDAMETHEGGSTYGGKAIYVPAPIPAYKDVSTVTLFESLINQWGRDNVVCVYNVDGNPEIVGVVQVNPDHYIITHPKANYMPTELTGLMMEMNTTAGVQGGA